MARYIELTSRLVGAENLHKSSFERTLVSSSAAITVLERCAVDEHHGAVTFIIAYRKITENIDVLDEHTLYHKLSTRFPHVAH